MQALKKQNNELATQLAQKEKEVEAMRALVMEARASAAQAGAPASQSADAEQWRERAIEARHKWNFQVCRTLRRC